MRGVLAFVTLPFVAVSIAASPLQASDPAVRLAATVADHSRSPDERGSALAELEQLDLSRAVEVAPALLTDADPVVRVRAAWILASTGVPTGFIALQAMASRDVEENNLAAISLGRLRHAGSHELLRGLLEQELRKFKPMQSVSRVSALSKALGDYGDASDAGLLARAIALTASGTDWPMVNDLGKTGGREAVPVLEETFRNPKAGTAAVVAGLGLARCGSEKGLDHVTQLLRGLAVSRKGADGGAQDTRAAGFVLELLGVPADEVLVPTILEIVSNAGYPESAKARAWDALLRINSPKYRKDVMSLAWKNTTFTSAVRLIVVNDEDAARRMAREAEAKGDVGARLEILEMKRALETPVRDRRQWRETHGYPL